MNGPGRRLFIAIEVPAGLAGRLADLVPPEPGVKRIHPGAIHLTLHFLGDVAAEAIPPLVAALDAAGGPSFTVTLGPRGRFPTRGPAGVLWVGVRDSPELAAAHDRSGLAIHQVGLPTESRRFTPHVTVARLGRGAGRRVAEDFLAGPPVEESFTATRIVLFASERTAAGPRHEPLHAVRLGT